MINLKYQRSCWWSRNILPCAEYRLPEEGDKSCPFTLLSQFTAAKIVISKIFLLSIPSALRCHFSIDHGSFIDISGHMKAKPHEKRANRSEWNRNCTLRADRWPCTSMYSDLNISLFSRVFPCSCIRTATSPTQHSALSTWRARAAKRKWE